MAAAKPPPLGKPVLRVDGRDKVTGRARYPSDEPLAGAAHAFLVTSPIPRGRISAIDSTEARALPGVRLILTHENVGPRVRPVAYIMKGGHANGTWLPLASPEIHYAGQIVAVVVADTYEAARDAARRLRIQYAAAPFAATFDQSGAEAVDLARVQQGHEDPRRGDAARAFATAPVRIEARYTTPAQHHNPIELFTTAAVWDGPKLTIYEPTRFLLAVKNGVATQLGIDPADVRVIAHFLGGHFGSKFALSQHTALVALAARELGRPVKLVPTRDQCFTVATFRPESDHVIRLGATQDGRLTAFVHEARQVTSRADDYGLAGTDVTARMYACPNIATHAQLVRVDRNTPGPMRAPPEVPYLFALESAMDELSYALALDPIELRRRNDTLTDPVKGMPFSTRPLMRCFDAGAQRFDWARRTAAPGSMRDGHWRVGLGCAAAMRPVQISPAAMRVRLTPDRRALIQTAHLEIGNGAMTVLAVLASEALGIPVENVTVELGDTAYPAASVSGGSTTTTSLSHVLAKACADVRDRLARAASSAADSPLRGVDPASATLVNGELRGPAAGEPLANAVRRLPGGAADVYAEYLPPGASPEAMEKTKQGRTALHPPSKSHYSAAFGAQFIEVRVHAETGEFHVTRMVGAFAAGRIVDSITTRSQLLGGMVFGLGSGLLEDSRLDPRTGGYSNHDLERYLLPVNADIPTQDVIVIEDDDHEVNPLGIKGLGELGLIGVNAAIANALFHATGRRIRSLPIRIEDLLL